MWGGGGATPPEGAKSKGNTHSRSFGSRNSIGSGVALKKGRGHHKTRSKAQTPAFPTLPGSLGWASGCPSQALSC